MNYYAVISYDGTHFNGWQAQRGKNLRTVQETLEKTAEEAFGVKTNITASGRTDAGVHALGQVCSFEAQTSVPPHKIADCLNAKLPSDVKILESGVAKDGFDACRAAKKKTYVYSLYLSERENPLKERYQVRTSPALDFTALRQCADILEGEHDFKAFCAANSTAKTTVRTVFKIQTEVREDLFGKSLLLFVSGNGFLYNMVRTMVGTLLDCGYHRKELSEVQTALETGNREKVGKTMPAKGLCLYSVEYD